MSITLNGIALPSDLEWQDEFDWYPVASSSVRSLTGKLLIEEAALVKGRQMTLYGGENAAWVSRATVESLQALAATPGTTMTLDYHGTAYTVKWRRDQTPIEAQQVLRLQNPGADHKYTITLRLIEVA